MTTFASAELKSNKYMGSNNKNFIVHQKLVRKSGVPTIFCPAVDLIEVYENTSFRFILKFYPRIQRKKKYKSFP